MDTYDHPQQSPESSTDIHHAAALERNTRDHEHMFFRNTCFMMTWQKATLYKGYDDDELAQLIRAAGGTVVRDFQDLIQVKHQIRKLC